MSLSVVLEYHVLPSMLLPLATEPIEEEVLNGTSGTDTGKLYAP